MRSLPVLVTRAASSSHEPQNAAAAAIRVRGRRRADRPHIIARFKLHPFVALIAVSLGLGAVAGMPLGSVVKAFQDGVGGVLGFIASGGTRDDAGAR